jgi:hypothetical protein
LSEGLGPAARSSAQGAQENLRGASTFQAPWARSAANLLAPLWSFPRSASGSSKQTSAVPEAENFSKAPQRGQTAVVSGQVASHIALRGDGLGGVLEARPLGRAVMSLRHIGFGGA